MADFFTSRGEIEVAIVESRGELVHLYAQDTAKPCTDLVVVSWDRLLGPGFPHRQPQSRSVVPSSDGLGGYR
jgi:hypothetical protein